MDRQDSIPNAAAVEKLSQLSPRQRECLEGVVALKPAKQIAHDLGISPSAVEKHLRQARDKLGVASTAEAGQILAAEKAAKFPHWGNSHLVDPVGTEDGGQVLRLPVAEQLGRVEDNQHGALPPDYPLTPLQTLTTIVLLSVASIVALLLLLSCGKAFESIVTS